MPPPSRTPQPNLRLHLPKSRFRFSRPRFPSIPTSRSLASVSYDRSRPIRPCGGVLSGTQALGGKDRKLVYSAYRSNSIEAARLCASCEDCGGSIPVEGNLRQSRRLPRVRNVRSDSSSRLRYPRGSPPQPVQSLPHLLRVYSTIRLRIERDPRGVTRQVLPETRNPRSPFGHLQLCQFSLTPHPTAPTQRD